MPSGPPIRASDQDRERTARQLSEHHAAGRIDAEEFSERLDKVYEAKTVAELDELTADLPAVDLYPLPTASLPRSRPVSTDLPATAVFRGAELVRRHSGWPIAWASWLVVAIVALLVSVLSGSLLPLGAAAAAGALMAIGQAASRARRHGAGPP